MPLSFRAKVKRAFGRSGFQSSDANHVQPSKSPCKGMKQKSEYPDHVYKPGERMPRPKYSAPVSRAHQEKLFAYSFEDAWKRRSSEHSLYSPRGSRFPSAVGSIRRRSFRPEISSRRASVVQGMLGKNGEYDNDVENGGLSKQHPGNDNVRPPPWTADCSTSTILHPQESRDSTNSMHERLDNSEMGMPFTEAELTLALTRTTITS